MAIVDGVAALEELDEADDGIWIEEVDIVSGRYDILLKVRFRELRDLTRLLIKHLAAFSEVEHSETFMVLQTVEEGRPLRIWGSDYGKAEPEEKGR